VHDAELVRLTERVQGVDQDIAHPLDCQRPFLVHHERQVLAAQELHREIEDPVVGPAEVDDTDAVGVVQAARGPRLLVEPCHRLLVAEQMRMDDLDRNGSPKRRLLGLVDAPHPADADDLLQQVAPPDDAADERVRSPACLLLVRRRPTSRTKARGSFYRRAALMAQAHLCSISHGVLGSN
jgi:hypothetical protein